MRCAHAARTGFVKVGTGSNRNQLPKQNISGLLDKRGASKLRYRDWLLKQDISWLSSSSQWRQDMEKL